MPNTHQSTHTYTPHTLQRTHTYTPQPTHTHMPPTRNNIHIRTRPSYRRTSVHIRTLPHTHQRPHTHTPRHASTYTYTHAPTHKHIVAGEKMWLDRDSNPGFFADDANTLPLSYRATWSYHQQHFTLNLPRLQYAHAPTQTHVCICTRNVTNNYVIISINKKASLTDIQINSRMTFTYNNIHVYI